MFRANRQNKRLLQLVAGAFLLPLLAHAYIGLSSHYIADDYCYAVAARQGILAAQITWYSTWQGSVSSNFLAMFSSLLPPETIRFLPATALTIWGLLLTWTVWQLKPVSTRAWRLSTSVLLATMTLALSLDGRPRMTPQTLYWLNGSLRYLAPQLVLVAYAGFVIFAQNRIDQRRQLSAACVVSTTLALIAGLFSEAHMAAQVTGTFLATLACAVFVSRPVRQKLLPLLSAGLAGSLIAFLVMALSPGMRVRQALLPAPPDLLTLGLRTSSYTLEFVREIVLRAPENLLLAAIVPALIARLTHGIARNATVRGNTRNDGLVPWLVAIPAGVLLLLAACFSTAAWALASFPPMRTLLIPQFLLFSAITTWSFLLGLWTLRDWPPRTNTRMKLSGVVTLSLILAWPLNDSWNTLDLRFEAEANAQTWDAFDRQLRQAKTQQLDSLQLPAPDNLAGLDLVGQEANFWVNSCVSDYYGVSVTGYPPPPIPNATALLNMSGVDVEIGNVATVNHYSLSRSFAWPGETLFLSVHWLPRSTTERPYRVSIDLYAENGQVHTQTTSLLNDTYDTTVWVPKRSFVDTYELKIPETTEATLSAPFVIGLYGQSESQRFPVVARGGAPGSVLGEIRILESQCGPNGEELHSLGRKDDAKLFEAVTKLLASDLIVGPLQIEVGVFDSAISLCDDQTSRQQRERAIELVTQNFDVAEVIDDMQ